ncbi:ABC transporter transmembrane region 2 [Hortaea werneckii]|uniref:ABC transporter domain-containing protein n=1 Tax=Hortaea werneckii TaxID=91943 RepID=A0A3M7I4U4_HORWE|nr:ABC transporter transmembrane region 2 [Hortaea werneckii]KAI6971333.1 ABC transporter transmembrane region 2 [Hortaea werneckii]KAI7024884.1 ABC transporter transmembrane region 2 [Hortaea werneckii]KAI7065248.1 ABC transporter transmembrane region 2 [Hortaea werneckii]KAI7123072.1 ABC transporter transmembrane region 2 [Hortaea werneckii]
MAAQSTLRLSPADRFSSLFDHYYERLSKRLSRLERQSPLSRRTTQLLATLALSLTIIAGSYGGYNIYRRRRTEHDQGRRLVRRNSGLRGKDGERTIFVPYKSSTAKVTIRPTKQSTFDAHRRLFLRPPKQTGMESGVPPTNIKPGLNMAFLHQFGALMNIMIPRWSSKETGLLTTHAIFLLLRTYLSLVVARIDGEIVRDLVGGKGKAFLLGLAKWLSIGAVSSYTNSMIKFLQSKISIAFRTRLTRYIHDLYLSPQLAYYKLHNLDGGAGQGADQFITQDLTLFCDSAAALYSSLGKPLVDLVTFNFQLYKSLGPLALSGLLINYFATATLLRKLSPPFGKMKAVEGRKEGDFRALHARLIANAEEVAFYAGGPTEHILLDQGFKELRKWMEGIYKIKVGYNMLEDFVLKYSWSAFGYLVTSLSVFLPALGGLSEEENRGSRASETGRTSYEDSSADVEHLGRDPEQSYSASERSGGRMKQFITNKRLMLSLADAGGRMMYSLKDLAELAGYTSRVYTLISSLHRVHSHAYHPTRGAYPELYSMTDVQGTLQKGFDGVRLENVPVVAPSLFPLGGEELIDNLSFIVGPGDHLLITGPNGAGKSAVSRIIAGLWPTYRGLTSRPRQIGQDGIMFLPQRPYLSPGTLRDQVICPHTELDMRESSRRTTDSDLQTILDQAKLHYLPSREGGWDTRKVWKDVLSGGEKQRISLARLLYHEPRYAIIDEGTSAVSSDVEGLLYETCKSKGITLITISTRASLKRYHGFLLTLGLGEEGEGYEFVRIGTKREVEGVEAEVRELRDRLGLVEGWRARRAEIEEELGRVWVKGVERGGGGGGDEEERERVLEAPPPPAFEGREEEVGE